MRFAVSAVTWRQAATRTPSRGRSAAKRSRIERRTGIWPSAQSTRARPSTARAGLAMSEPSDLVAIVVALVGPLDRHADVRRLLGRQLCQPRAEGVEVQPRHLLVEMLRQHVHGLAVLVGLG